MSTLTPTSVIFNTAPEALEFAKHVVQALLDNAVLLTPEDEARLLVLIRDEAEGRELASDMIRGRIARVVAERLFHVTPGTVSASVENATLKFYDAIRAIVTATLETLADLAADEVTDRAIRVAGLLVDAGMLAEAERRLFTGSLDVELDGHGDNLRAVAGRVARSEVLRRTGYGPGNDRSTTIVEERLRIALLVALLATA